MVCVCLSCVRVSYVCAVYVFVWAVCNCLCVNVWCVFCVRVLCLLYLLCFVVCVSVCDILVCVCFVSFVFLRCMCEWCVRM